MRRFLGPLATTLLSVAPALGWEHWGGDPGGTRFSPLRRSRPPMSATWFAPGNFAPAISTAAPPAVMARTKFQATPLFVEDSLIFCSPFNEVIALDPGTGAQKWRYDPKIATSQRPATATSAAASPIGSTIGPPKARLPSAHLHGHQRCPRDRARRKGPAFPAPISATAARSSSISAKLWTGRANSRSPRRRW